MPTLENSGTQGAVVATEHTLATNTTNKTFVLAVDTANMKDVDVVTLRLKTKILSGDASQLAYGATFGNIQGEPNKYSVPVPANIELVATLEQTAGAAMTGGPTLQYIDANPDTITRSAGSWDDDNFFNGDTIEISGSASNDGTYTIASHTTTVLTLIMGDTLIAEGPTGGHACTGGRDFKWAVLSL